MSEPFIGEIRQFSGEAAPAGWALCDGRLMAVNEHRQLFDLLGNQFGGDGRRTFALPALSGRGQPTPADGVLPGRTELPSRTELPGGAVLPGGTDSSAPRRAATTRFIIAVHGRSPVGPDGSTARSAGGQTADDKQG